MGLEFTQIGADSEGNEVRQGMNRKGEDTGAIVFTEPLVARGDNVLLPFVDSTGSADLNVNVGFSGTPELVHDGTDLTAWSASNLSGTNFVFASTTHAAEGIITVVDFTALSGATVTINGTNITNTTLTEGVNWTAATSNAATATSLESAVEGISGVTSTVTSNVITVKIDRTVALDVDITTFSTSASAGQLIATAQSINGQSTVNTDTALFEDPTSTDMSNFVAMSAEIFITAWPNPQTGKNLSLQARLNGINVGSSILIGNFIDVADFNVWQTIAINKSDFNLDIDTIDEFILVNIDTAPGQPIDFFFDTFQIEQAGAPVIFSLAIPEGTVYNLQQLVVSFREDTGVTIVNGVPIIDPAKFAFQSRLAIGVINRITINNLITETTVIRCNQDFINITGTIKNKLTDNSASGAFTVEFSFGNGAQFIQSRGDGTDCIVNDDLSGLEIFRINATGDLRDEVPGDV